MPDIQSLQPQWKPSPWPKILLFTGSLVLIGLLVSIGIYYRQPTPFLSPLVESFPFLSTSYQPPTTNKIILGFLPYWTISQVNELPLKYLTHLSYFGVALDAQGNILTQEPDGSAELGAHRLNQPPLTQLLRRAKTKQINTILVLRAMKPDVIESLVNDPLYRNQAIAHTLKLVEEYNFDGVNIDFEYSGTPPDSTKAAFTLFVRQLSGALKRDYPQTHLSLDVFADAAIKDRLWDLKPLSLLVDHLIIMTYDFHRPSSPYAGPVAPLHGSCPLILTQPSTRCPYDYDVSQAVADFTRLIPPQKILLGIPFYGYEWQVTRALPFAPTYPNTGSLATIARVQKLLASPPDQLITHWDERALSPYLTYQQNRKNFIIWYENARSLSYKFDLVNQADLGGIAIWALGYDANSEDIWSLIPQKFSE